MSPFSACSNVGEASHYVRLTAISNKLAPLQVYNSHEVNSISPPSKKIIHWIRRGGNFLKRVDPGQASLSIFLKCFSKAIAERNLHSVSAVARAVTCVAACINGFLSQGPDISDDVCTILSSLTRSTDDSRTCRTQLYRCTRSGFRRSTDMWMGLKQTDKMRDKWIER